MILFTPASVRRCASALTMPATSASNLTLRGDEIVGVSGGETPMMPIRWLPLRDDDRVGDPPLVAQLLQHGLAGEVRVGRQERQPLPSPAMNFARRVGPKSYSWLPIVTAS